MNLNIKQLYKSMNLQKIKWHWAFLLLLFCCLQWSCQRATEKKKVEPASAIMELPLISIETDSYIPWDYQCPCNINYKSKGESACWSGNIKCRGGVSSKFEKYSYALKFSKKHSLCGLPANKSWILNANYIDKTFMRHKLCYDLFRMMDERDLAPQCAYAMLQHNGNPLGLYVVMQRLTKHVLQLDVSDTNAYIFKEPKVFYTKLPSPNYVEGSYHGQTYPDYDEYGDKSAIMDEFRKFIVKSTDEQFMNEIGQWIDIDNVIDWHLLVLFTNNSDGLAKNFYLYKKNTDTPFRIALWDCDHSFGRDGDNEMNMLERLADIQKNIMLARLARFQEYQKALAERYCQLRKDGVFSYENIYQMVQDNDRYIRLGIDENVRLWPFDSENYYDGNNYEEEVKLLLEFVPLSLKRLDEMFGYH